MKGRRLLLVIVAASVVLCPRTLFANIEAIKKETNLQRRSRLALENADAALDQARQAYQKGDGEALDLAFAEVIESVELAYQSLVERGRNPRRNAGPYKRGELSTRDLLRRLDTFRDEMSYVDRERVESVIEAVEQVHESFLRDVMGGRQ